MKRYRVYGIMSVVVTTIVESKTDLSEEEIYAKAHENFEGITNYAGNGGVDKLVGVVNESDTIISDDNDVEFNDYEFISSQ